MSTDTTARVKSANIAVTRSVEMGNPVPDIIAATAEHIPFIAEHIRLDDEEELWASVGMSPSDALGMSLAESALSWTGTIDGVPVCMFGVAEFSEGKGRPWMIGTDHLNRYPFIFLSHCRGCLDQMLEHYPYLENYADQRNTRALAWLRWLGFTFDDPEPMGPFGLPFIRFEMRRKQ